MITADILRPMLARLSLSFGQPYGLSSSSADGLVSVWLTAVGDCEPKDLSQAIDQWIRTQKKWPSPATMREDAWAITRARKPAHQESNGAFCLRCHTHDLIEIANGRLMPLHADNCPGLHANDRLDITHAQVTGRPVWVGGDKPKPAA